MQEKRRAVGSKDAPVGEKDDGLDAEEHLPWVKAREILADDEVEDVEEIEGQRDGDVVDEANVQRGRGRVEALVEEVVAGQLQGQRQDRQQRPDDDKLQHAQLAELQEVLVGDHREEAARHRKLQRRLVRKGVQQLLLAVQQRDQQREEGQQDEGFVAAEGVSGSTR